MKRKLTVVSLLLWVLLAVGPLNPPAAQAQGLTLTLRTDQATYQVGSQATVTFILRSTTPMNGVTGVGALGCDWNIIILDTTGTEVVNVSEGLARRGFICEDTAFFRNLPPPIVKRGTIPLHNNLQEGEALPPGLYTLRAIIEWSRTKAPFEVPLEGLGPLSAEMVIEITR